MIKSLLLVGLGSCLGGVLRYSISTFVKNSAGGVFPWGTLAVNLIGCFLFGVVCALFAKYPVQNSGLYLLLTTGVLGGFTTFSAFAHESVGLLQSGNVASFFCYVGVSVVAGLLLVATGYSLVGYLAK